MLMLRLWFFGERVEWNGTRHSRTLAKVVEFRRRTHSRTLVVGEPALRNEHSVFTRQLTTTVLCWQEGGSSSFRFFPTAGPGDVESYWKFPGRAVDGPNADVLPLSVEGEGATPTSTPLVVATILLLLLVLQRSSHPPGVLLRRGSPPPLS